MHTQTQTHTQTHTQIQTQNKPTQIIYTLTYKHLNLDAHKSNLHTRPTHTYNKAVTQNDMKAQWPSAPFSSSYSDRKRVKSREDLPKTRPLGKQRPFQECRLYDVDTLHEFAAVDGSDWS